MFCRLRISSYHGNNGIFKSKEFTESIDNPKPEGNIESVCQRDDNQSHEREGNIEPIRKREHNKSHEDAPNANSQSEFPSQKVKRRVYGDEWINTSVILSGLRTMLGLVIKGMHSESFLHQMDFSRPFSYEYLGHQLRDNLHFDPAFPITTE